MLFVTTQPDSDYYIWQLQVQLNNFKKFGCEDKCVVIFGFNPLIGINPNAIKFEKNTTAKILYYPDTRDLSLRIYLPSIRPHLLKKLYRDNPEVLENKNFLYMDCDIIFTDYPDFSELNDEDVIHVSDTSTHFSFDFIKLKDIELFNKMCKIVGISPYTVDLNAKSNGGISYLFKEFHYFDYEFWNKVEIDSVTLYKMMLVTIHKHSYIQILTANKWALIWNIWLMGYDTKVTSELSLCWATDMIEKWSVCNLYNNAGVTVDHRLELFYKGDFVEKSPFEVDLSYVSDQYCSVKYVDEIYSTAKALKLIN